MNACNLSCLSSVCIRQRLPLLDHGQIFRGRVKPRKVSLAARLVGDTLWLGLDHVGAHLIEVAAAVGECRRVGSRRIHTIQVYISEDESSCFWRKNYIPTVFSHNSGVHQRG